ncbi:hypothetical protein BJY01DRAFT_32563 [Aspergillus pseudoustus]|uniref:Uncharacterized protein n=1 Tax=Aspergillus pseudoustus TaxID=1810923 RepID=A0ABR4JFI9_9EURO
MTVCWWVFLVDPSLYLPTPTWLWVRRREWCFRKFGTYSSQCGSRTSHTPGDVQLYLSILGLSLFSPAPENLLPLVGRLSFSRVRENGLNVALSDTLSSSSSARSLLQFLAPLCAIMFFLLFWPVRARTTAVASGVSMYFSEIFFFFQLELSAGYFASQVRR